MMNRRSFLAAIPVIASLPATVGSEAIDPTVPDIYHHKPGDKGGVWGWVKYRIFGESHERDIKLFRHCINDFARTVARENPNVLWMKLRFDYDQPGPPIEWYKSNGRWFNSDNSTLASFMEKA
jgi:hypothetical protein